MNANELADLLEVDSWYKLVTREEIAAMLRQQQAEIEALKQIIDANNLNQNIGQFVKPTNEPVAWTDGKGNYFDKNSFFPVDDLIPLYTHPVKEQDESFDRTASHMVGEYVSYQKELTDAITLLEKYADKLEDERPNKGLSDVVLECVEILRKAQDDRK